MVGAKLNIRLSAIWLLIATSSVVLIEPAPFDVLAMALIIGFFSFGLRIPPNLSTPLVLLTIFMVANILAAMFAVDPGRCVGYILITFYLILTWLFFTCVIYDDPEAVYQTIWNAYLFSSVIAVFFAIIGYFKLIPQYEFFMSWDRARGTFKDPNVLAAYLIPPVLYLVFRLEGAKFNQFLLKLLLLIFLMIGILLSFSRGAWVNLAISTVVYIGFRFALARSTHEISGLITAGAFISIATMGTLVWAITTSEIAEVFFRRASFSQNYDVGAGGRFDTLQIVMQQIFQNPIGIGPGESKYVRSLDPHNLYIHITSETGWLGGLAFCSFILVTVWQGFLFALTDSKLQGSFLVVFACLVGTLLENMIIHGTHWRHLYLLLAMLWGVMITGEKLMPKKISYS